MQNLFFLFGLFLVTNATLRTPVRRRVRIHAFCTHFANSYGVEKRAIFALFLLYKRIFLATFCFLYILHKLEIQNCATIQFRKIGGENIDNGYKI